MSGSASLERLICELDVATLPSWASLEILNDKLSSEIRVFGNFVLKSMAQSYAAYTIHKHGVARIQYEVIVRGNMHFYGGSFINWETPLVIQVNGMVFC